MSRELSLPAEALVAYAKTRAGEAVTAEALHTWVAAMTLPTGAIDDLPFGPELRQRWDAAIGDRVTELTGVRDRLGDTATRLCQAAADFEDADIAAAIDVARTVGDPELLPLLTSRFAAPVVLTAEPDRRAPRLDFAATHTEGEVPSTLDPNFETDTAGPPRMRALRTEHLAVLRRAEQLLSDQQRLDFKRPTEYLDELERVRPGAVRTRADLLAVAAATVGQAARAGQRETRELGDRWRGGAASVAFTGHAEATARYQAAVAAELAWLRDQGEALWRLVDGLLCDIADDAERVVESVADSRIGRIRQAVELLDDARAHAPDSQGANAWGWYSGADVDLVTQMLYKRVWYLSNAFGGSLDRASRAAKTLVDNDTHPVTAAPPTPPGGDDWTGDWSVGDKLPLPHTSDLR